MIALFVLAACAVIAVVCIVRENDRQEAARFRRVQDDFDQMARSQRDTHNH